ncbi:glycosyltransferase family 1 protein [Paraburkholderia sp. J67]|uniref:glycosyltransferase family 4 protein n=1 Tax=Paraburkholderia sp. J67 TaxID=2805435 RepID=UPI002ABE6C67|nr:glycosyltransferase family 1 protein [Paraburkholderia sp. J67]
MTQILLDVTRLARRLHEGLLPTGVDRVGLAYVEQYAARARAVFSYGGFAAVLSDEDSLRIFDFLLTQQRKRSFVAASVLRGYGTSVLRERFENACLLHTSHNGMEYSRFYAAMGARGVRSVFMIHDLIPLTHAEYCRPDVDKAHRIRIDTALANADGLIANSYDTERMLVQYAAERKLPLPPVAVAPLASGVGGQASYPRLCDAPYFVMLGTIEPRKNHWFMLHIWRRLVEAHGSAAPRLVIIGRRGWECENAIDMLERCEALRQHVIEETHCDDARLRAWLTHARALLFPSFVEGYGMPLVEALEMRLPVIASELAVFREIAGDIPDYLDPLDGPGWTRRVLDYTLDDSPARDRQIARIGNFRAPTWSEHFLRIDTFLATIG